MSAGASASVVAEQWHGEQIFWLRAGRAQAWVWPGCGMNLFRLRLPAAEGAKVMAGGAGAREDDAVELLAAPPTPEALRQGPARYGNPILFPWVARMPQGQWRLPAAAGSAVLQFPATDGAGNASHGVVRDADWAACGAVTAGAANGEAWIEAAITEAELAPALRAGLGPFRFRLTARFTLSEADGLAMRFVIENTSSRQALPFAFGLHPYFHTPWRAGGQRVDVRVGVPGDGTRWNLEALRSPAPTTDNAPNANDGRCPDLLLPGDAGTAASGAPGRARRHEFALGADLLDHVFAAGAPRREMMLELVDPSCGERIELTASGDVPFTTATVFTPADRPICAIEPWTAPPNAQNLPPALAAQAGIQTLSPSAHTTLTASIKLVRAT